MPKSRPPSIGERFRSGGTYNNQAGSCPHCGHAALFQTVVNQNCGGARLTAEAHPTKAVHVEVARCLACSALVFGAVEIARDGRRDARQLWPSDVWADGAPADLEEEIRTPYDEARMILPFSAAAAAVLARRCLQQVIRTRLGITERTLFAEISKAANRPELSQPTRDSLDHIREIGNWAAHPDVDPAGTLIEITREEAEYTLQALEMVFDDLYVATARAAQMQQRIASRKGTANAVT